MISAARWTTGLKAGLPILSISYVWYPWWARDKHSRAIMANPFKRWVMTKLGLSNLFIFKVNCLVHYLIFFIILKINH